MGNEYRDESWLYEQYHRMGKDQYEIADECGVDQAAISRWIKRHGIRARKPGSWDRYLVSFRTHRKGYERWATEVDGKKRTVRVHRLLAVAVYGFDAVADREVHHRNHIPWDNRPGNIVPLDTSEHRNIHAKGGEL